MAPTALSSGAAAAHAAFWARSSGGRKLSEELVQKKLVAYFTSRGEALVDLPTAVDMDDVTAWKDEWEDIAT